MSTPSFDLPRPTRTANSAAGPRQPRTVPQTVTPPVQMNKTKPDVNKTKHFGGINLNPALNLTIVGTNNSPGQGAAPAGPSAGAAGSSTGTPGAGFMSNEDIHAFCEHVRKHARNRAVERTMDAEQLESVLRHIPTPDGAMGGARFRAIRVSRHLKRIGRAEQLIAKEAAALYAQFQREYESELNKVGKARPKPAAKFTF